MSRRVRVSRVEGEECAAPAAIEVLRERHKLARDARVLQPGQVVAGEVRPLLVHQGVHDVETVGVLALRQIEQFAHLWRVALVAIEGSIGPV